MIPRSIGRIVEDQARRWELAREQARQHKPPEEPRGVITVSRQPGAGGMELARELAELLSYDLFDRELLHEIAESAHLSERLVATLDERDRSSLGEWLADFALERHLTPRTYLHHLTHVVGVISCQGGAVIMGRGAHLVLGPRAALRVLAVAPLAARVARVAAHEEVDEAEARRRIEQRESERGAFLRHLFHADSYDLTAFDLVVNTDTLGIRGAAKVAAGALPAIGRRARIA